ncbi:MAG: Crp/Fnr family transcriptional regulator [Pseudomonadota bacterium]
MSKELVHHCAICPSRLEGVFCELDGSQVEELNGAKTTNQYKRGQVIFYEGNQPKGLFCVYRGKIKLFKTGDDGRETIIKVEGPGDILGYRSILTDEPYNLTAEVIEDAEVCFIDKHFFSGLIAKEPSIALSVLRRLGHELAIVQAQLSDVLSKSVRQRLSHLLLTLQKTHGQKQGNETFIDLRLTRTELASMVGATPETVIRLLSDFSDSNYIRLDGKRILIRNSGELLREANIEV